MDQQRIIFETSPGFIILCLLLGIGYAYLLYTSKHPWSKVWNRVLFAIRAVLAFFLAFLLLGPIVKQINNLIEKPLLVIVHDNSASIKEVTDTVTLQKLHQDIDKARELLGNQGYDVAVNNLDGREVEFWQYNGISSDLHEGLKKTSARYEGKNVEGVVLVSDGIYNTGLSPLYANYNFPVYTLGVGDTTQRADISIKNIAYNKIAYQGNKFPLRIEVLVKGLPDRNINVSLLQRGAVLEQQTKNSGSEQLLTFDFQPLANEEGIQKMDIQVEVLPGEYNSRNNRSSVFVEVVAGKKKILVVAPAPHPDIKALRTVVEKNSNYEFMLHIPGLEEQQASVLDPNNIDLAIFNQSPDVNGKTRDLFQRFSQSRTAMLVILGQQSDLVQLSRLGMPVRFESIPRDYDEITPIINLNYSNFSLSSETNSLVPDYPPVSVHFGKIQVPLTATPILFQKVGSIGTNKPLLAVDVQDTRKIGIMLGEGFWRWRLHEFDKTESTQAFDELFGKLIQYLSTAEDKRKFRSYPVKQEFSDTEPVVFESQVYNDIFEPVYGNTIEIELTDDVGKKRQYTYATSPGNTRYQVGGLPEGVYRYRSSTTINERRETVRGEFAVVAKLAELQNLSADFNLLRRLSTNTGGEFYPASRANELIQKLSTKEAKSIIRTEEAYNSIINLKWVFWVLLILVGFEWFMRKFLGSY